MSQPKDKNMKSSKFPRIQNTVHFQVVSTKPLMYPRYSQGSQNFQNHLLSMRFSINFPNITSQDKTSLELANNAINP